MVLVAIQLSVPGLYLPPVFKLVGPLSCRPKQSFHCRSTLPCDKLGLGRVGEAGGCPTIGAGIVSPAGIKIVAADPAPDDHFTTGPDCRVTSSGGGALVVLVAVQLSVLGLYLPPVFK